LVHQNRELHQMHADMQTCWKRWDLWEAVMAHTVLLMQMKVRAHQTSALQALDCSHMRTRRQ